MRIQQHFSVEDLGTFRTKLLREVEKYNKPYTKDLQDKEQRKADHALHLMMNYYTHQLEF
jgi:hypothetical protein